MPAKSVARLSSSAGGIVSLLSNSLQLHLLISDVLIHPLNTLSSPPRKLGNLTLNSVLAMTGQMARVVGVVTVTRVYQDVESVEKM